MRTRVRSVLIGATELEQGARNIRRQLLRPQPGSPFRSRGRLRSSSAGIEVPDTGTCPDWSLRVESGRVIRGHFYVDVNTPAGYNRHGLTKIYILA